MRGSGRQAETLIRITHMIISALRKPLKTRVFAPKRCCRSQIFNSHEVEVRQFCIIIHSQPYIYAELPGAQQCLVCPHVSAQTWSSGVRQTPHLCRRNRSKYDMTAKNNTAAKVCSFAAGTANGLYSIFLFAPKFQHLT